MFDTDVDVKVVTRNTLVVDDSLRGIRKVIAIGGQSNLNEFLNSHNIVKIMVLADKSFLVCYTV